MSYPTQGQGYPPQPPGYPNQPQYSAAGGPPYPTAPVQGYPPGNGQGYPPGGGQGGQGYPPSGGQGYPPGGVPGFPGTGSAYPPSGGGPGYAPGGGQGYPAMGGFPPPGGMATNPYPVASQGYAAPLYPPLAPGYGGQGPVPAGFVPSGHGYQDLGAGYGGPSPGGAGVMAQGSSSYPGQAGYGTGSRFTPAFGGTTAGGGFGGTTQGTIRPHRNFNAVEDANALRQAMKGLGTDEKAIIGILCKRSSDQRMQIVAMYKQCHGRDLIRDIKSELRSRFEDVMVGLLYPMHEYLARELRRAIAGLGTDEDCLVEILCTRSNSDINAIKQVYQQIFNKDLERDIMGDTSGHFRRVLVSMCNGAREEGLVPDPFRARNDAHLLHQAGAARWGTDESTFNRILASQSYEQLTLVFREYQALTNHTIMEAISSEMSGDLRAAFLAIVKSVVNIQYYFAEKLYKAMKGMGTNDKALVRIIVSRCEIDLVQIKEEYQRNFNVSLENAIQSDTSGDYRLALLALVHGN